MLELIEKDPLPQICQECEAAGEADCGSCDNAGDRWILPREEELWLKRKLKIKAIQRLERELSNIDTELAEIMATKGRKEGGA